MKKFTKGLLAMALVLSSAFTGTVKAADGVKIDSKTFPDAGFRTAIKEYADTNKDGYLSEKELNTKSLVIYSEEAPASLEHDSTDVNFDIKDTTGLKLFTKLESLYIYDDVKTSVGKAPKINFTGLSYLKNLKSLKVSKDFFYNLNLENVKSDYVYVMGLVFIKGQTIKYEYLNKNWSADNVKQLDDKNFDGDSFSAKNSFTLVYRNKDGKNVLVGATSTDLISEKAVEDSLVSKYKDGYKVSIVDEKNIIDAVKVYRQNGKELKNVKVTKNGNSYDFNVKIGGESTYTVEGYKYINGHKVRSAIKEFTLDGKVPGAYIVSMSKSVNSDKTEVTLNLLGDTKRIDRYQVYGYNSKARKYERIFTSKTNKSLVEISSKYTKLRARTFKTTKNGNVYSKWSFTVPTV